MAILDVCIDLCTLLRKYGRLRWKSDPDVKAKTHHRKCDGQKVVDSLEFAVSSKAISLCRFCIATDMVADATWKVSSIDIIPT